MVTRQAPLEEVVARLKQDIRMGMYVPGEHLPEAHLQAALGISRMRAREALRILEAEGLVVLEPFRGASVRKLENTEIAHIYRAREALEGMAARDFAEQPHSAHKDQLVRLQEQMTEATRLDAPEHFADLNSQWHQLIVDATGNRYYDKFLQRLHLPAYRLLFRQIQHFGNITLANSEHIPITAAIVAGDGSAAEAHMRAHVRNSYRAVERLLG